MTKLIADAALSFNVGKNMDLKQAWETSELILKEFNDWKMANIQQCFDRAKSGRYGRSFDRLDCQVIMEWCSAYDLERMEGISMQREKENGLIKQEMRGDSFYQIKNKATGETLMESLYKNYTAPLKEKDLMQRFFNEKYDLWERLLAKQNGDKFPNNRFLYRYGKMLNGTDFVTYKLDQKTRIENLRNGNTH